MDEEQYTQKTVPVNNEKQFEQMSEELLKNWKEYKKLDTRMKLLDASVKKYMTDKKLYMHENKYGHLLIVTQNRRVLDRALIDDIEKYKVDAEFFMMYKSAH
jgi:hypothetical protein